MLVFVAVDVVVVIAVAPPPPPTAVAPGEDDFRALLPVPAAAAPPTALWTGTVSWPIPVCGCPVWSTATTVGIIESIVPSVLMVQSLGEPEPSNGIMVTVLPTSSRAAVDCALPVIVVVAVVVDWELTRTVGISLREATLRQISYGHSLTLDSLATCDGSRYLPPTRG